jgi:uncharacterized membrane protein
MADYQAVPTGSSTQEVVTRQPPTTSTLVAYLLFALAAVTQIAGSGLVVPAPLLTIVGIIGVVIAYVQRGDARGTWVESHLTWLIRTFWWSTIWAVIGWIVFLLFAIILIGLALGPLIWGATAIWVLYRVIRGALLFKDSKPVSGM